MHYRFSEFLDALRTVQLVMCEVRAWNDNDGCSTLNEFAFSGVGGRRSQLLQWPITEVRRLASETLEFNGDGMLNRHCLNAIRDAGFGISGGCHDQYVHLEVPPTDEVIADYERSEEDDDEADYPPLPMTLNLINVEEDD